MKQKISLLLKFIKKLKSVCQMRHNHSLIKRAPLLLYSLVRNQTENFDFSKEIRLNISHSLLPNSMWNQTFPFALNLPISPKLFLLLYIEGMVRKTEIFSISISIFTASAHLNIKVKAGKPLHIKVGSIKPWKNEEH